MNESVSQFFNVVNALPLSKKISMVFVIILVITGFSLMFFWTNQENYQVLFSNLSQRDASAIAAKLKERNMPYKVEANGTMIMVPEEKVYELRLSLAGDGLPNGGNVGFEIFDHTDFKTTKFVQELNYRRALQGELARTINRFKEVNDSRVFIAIPQRQFSWIYGQTYPLLNLRQSYTLLPVPLKGLNRNMSRLLIQKGGSSSRAGSAMNLLPNSVVHS